MAVLLSDSFTAPNGTPLDGRALDVGGSWTQATGIGYEVQSDKARAGAGERILHADAGEADVALAVTVGPLAAGVDFAGVVLRWQDNGNNWMALFERSGSTLDVWKQIGGAFTLVASTPFTGNLAADKVLEVACFGSTIEARCGGDVVRTSAASQLSSATRCGLYAFGSSGAVDFDDFAASELLINTAARRASCYGLALPFLRTGIVPTGADLDAPERLHTQALYAGIAAAEPEPTESPQWNGTTFPGSRVGVAVAGGRAAVAVAAGRVAVPTLEIEWRNPPGG